MNLWVTALLMISILATTASYANDELELYSKLSPSQIKLLETKNSTAFEWRPVKYYTEITPKIFLRRALNDDPFKYLNLPMSITSADIEEIWQYVQRDELYRHDFASFEQFLKDIRFKGAFVVHGHIHTKAPFEIDRNLKEGYAFLKKYDADNKTTYSQKYSLAYLSRMFTQPRGIMMSSVSSTILADFLVHIDSYEEALSKEVLEVVQLGIRYYRARLSVAHPLQERIIHNELLTIANKSINFAKKHGDAYTIKNIQHTLQDESEIANKKGVELVQELKKGSLSGQELADINNNNNLRTFISNFIKDISNGGETFTDILHRDSIVRVSAKSYTPKTTNGNVVSLGSTKEKIIKETIFTVHVVKPSVHSAEAVSIATSILLATPQVYGVYFDDRIRIPSALNQKDFEISNMGSEVLIRNKPKYSVCKKEFGP